MDWTLILLVYFLVALGATALLALGYRFFKPESEVTDSAIATIGLTWPISTVISLVSLIHPAFEGLARLCRKVGAAHD